MDTEESDYIPDEEPFHHKKCGWPQYYGCPICTMLDDDMGDEDIDETNSGDGDE